MSEDWKSGDPFADPEDPAAAAREQRRIEREERRRKDEEKEMKKRSGEKPPPATPPPPEPPAVERTPEEAFWDEEPEEESAAPPPTPPPPPSEGSDEAPAKPPAPVGGSGASGGSRRGTWLLLGGLAAVIIVGGAIAAYAVVNHEDAPPPPPPKTVTVTIPEGYSREQTAAVAEEAGLRGDYLKASVSSPVLSPAKYGGKKAESLEGFLFPDTFEINARAPVRDLVTLQLEDFKQRLSGVNLRYAKSKNLSVYDVVTIASMVEREAMLDGERKLIAAVIYNRLRDGIPLGIDATIRFATGNFSEPLTESELATDSPYNTRVNQGLPPGPIGNPGLASLEAAAHPAKVDYLYYVVEPGTCGKHSFSTTDVEFQADVARYNAAREEAGGNSPDSCG